MIQKIFKRLYKYKVLKVQARQQKYDKIVEKFRKKLYFKAFNKVTKQLFENRFSNSNLTNRSMKFETVQAVRLKPTKKRGKRRCRSSLRKVRGLEFNKKEAIKIIENFETTTNEDLNIVNQSTSSFTFRKYKHKKVSKSKSKEGRVVKMYRMQQARD